MSEEELREQGLFGVVKVKRRDLVAVFRYWEEFRDTRAILGGAQPQGRRQWDQASTRQILLRYWEDEREEPIDVIRASLWLEVFFWQRAEQLSLS